MASSENKRKSLIAHLSMFGACAFWGLMAPLGKDAMTHGIDGLTMVSFRVLGGCLLFWITSLFVKKEEVPLRDKLMFIGAEAVCKTVDIIASGNVNAIEQDSIRTEGLHPAPKITKEFCQINWNSKAVDIHNLIRGLSPYPAAWCYLKDDITAKIFTSSYSNEKHNLNPGTFVTDNKSFLKVATADGFVSIHELQMQGKKRMAIKDFLNGFKFNTDN